MDPIEVDPVDIVERPVDSKGRVSVGTDYAGETVVAAVVEVVGSEPDDEVEDDEDPESAYLCGSCQQTILAREAPSECPSCLSDSIERLDVVRVEGGDRA